jgi:hypothetical protein
MHNNLKIDIQVNYQIKQRIFIIKCQRIMIFNIKRWNFHIISNIRIKFINLIILINIKHYKYQVFNIFKVTIKVEVIYMKIIVRCYIKKNRKYLKEHLLNIKNVLAVFVIYRILHNWIIMEVK